MKHESLLNYSGDIDLKDEFRKMVAVNAYYRAKKRGFEPGHEMDDWLEAEQEITISIAIGSSKLHYESLTGKV